MLLHIMEAVGIAVMIASHRVMMEAGAAMEVPTVMTTIEMGVVTTTVIIDSTVTAVMTVICSAEVAGALLLGLLIPPVKFARNMVILQVNVGGAKQIVIVMMMRIINDMREVHMVWIQIGIRTLVLLTTSLET